jgi:hypothetical protein
MISGKAQGIPAAVRRIRNQSKRRVFPMKKGLCVCLTLALLLSMSGAALAVNEDVDFKIHDIVARNEAEFAYPSTSVYLENRGKNEV